MATLQTLWGTKVILYAPRPTLCLPLVHACISLVWYSKYVRCFSLLAELSCNTAEALLLVSNSRRMPSTFAYTQHR